MKKATVVEKITRENWESSHAVWLKVVEKTKDQEAFSDSGGFIDLRVVSKCGYCKQFGDSGILKSDCGHCPLLLNKICFSNGYLDDGESVFWQYVQEMRTSIVNPELVDWNKALSFAERILKVIEDDEPSK